VDWTRAEDGTSFRSSEYQTGAVRDAFLDSLDEVLPARREPWFALVAFQAPHAPFYVPPIGAILAAVDLDETVVVVAADNGTPPPAVHAKQESGKVMYTSYEDSIRVPMVWAGPGIASGSETGALASLVDVLPTLAELLGVDVRPRLERNGISLASVLADPDAAGPREYAFAGIADSTYPTDLAIVTRRWKLREVEGALSLHDLARVPDEEVDLAGPKAAPPPLPPASRSAGRSARFAREGEGGDRPLGRLLGS
jgi:arylsulfatase A-like enzyme